MSESRTTYLIHDGGRTEPTSNARVAEFYSHSGYRVTASTESER